MIHGDFHFLGNIFFAPNDVRPQVIDWSEAKPGLGPTTSPTA
ncbi:aminoglycoside phosphotransferase family protein [Kribbella antiqua]|nr:aminoglycoside phosphotransferase family protein [Kribbella antiqua]